MVILYNEDAPTIYHWQQFKLCQMLFGERSPLLPVIRIDENDNLVVSMEKKDEKNEDKKEGRYLRREFSYSKFQQTMVLPENAEKDKIEAKVEHGVLNIIIPKMSEEAAKKAEKIIEIK